MKIWIIRDYEPLPTDPGDRRLLRAGMLATTLASLGHQTTWFTSTLDHYLKRHRADGDVTLKAAENLTIRVFKARGYKRNISVRRVIHNHDFARAFEKFAARCDDLPDVIVTDIPTTEAAQAAVAFGLQKNIPTVLSIRDLWPDFFTDFVPRPARPLARLAVRRLDTQARFACQNATSLVGISQSYLTWGQAKGEGRATGNDRIFPLGYRPEVPPDTVATEEMLKQMGIDPRKRLVAFTGSWGSTYDLDLVERTARHLVSNDAIQFVIAGDSVSNPALRERFSKLPNVVLPGWLDAVQIAALLSRAAIGLMPYTQNAPQGLPNKVFEYMAYGAYQLATLGGEVEDLYERTHTGKALPGASAGDLAAAIEEIFASQHALLSRESRIAQFKELFDADVIYHAMAEHITDMAKLRNG